MGKQVTELDALPSFTDTSLLPVHNGAGLKKGQLSQLASYLGTKFSNPNLLINPDFKINQRGQSTYSSTETICTVDRWIGQNTKTVVNSDGTVTVASLSNRGHYTQNEENISYGKHTYSIYVQEITGTVKFFYKNKDSKDYQLGILKQGLNTFVSSDDGFKALFFQIGSGSSVTLKYAKVEQGTVATAFIAPNNSDELDKCLRYFESGSLDTAPGLAIQQTVYIRTYIHPKRINPTPKFSGNLSFEMHGTGKNLTLTYLGTDLNTECCTFRFKPSEAMQYGLGFCKNFAYEIDAEIY